MCRVVTEEPVQSNLANEGRGVVRLSAKILSSTQLLSRESESVDELLLEGNTFEAEAVKGVEDAGDADGAEVRTHEAPQDDVPGEYLDKK